jgi:hypothetical protein
MSLSSAEVLRFGQDDMVEQERDVAHRRALLGWAVRVGCPMRVWVVRELVLSSCQSQRDQRFLLHLVGPGRTGRGTGAGRTLHGQHRTLSSDVTKAGQHVEECSHVGGFFLYPDHFAGGWVLVDGGFQFGFGERVHLVDEDDGGVRVFAALALDAEFVADFSGADQNALGVFGARVGDDGQETLMREVFDRGIRVRVAQHAFGREDHERLAPVTQCLAAQHVKILRGVRGLADLEIVACRELQEALDAGTGVFGALAFIAVGEQKH